MRDALLSMLRAGEVRPGDRLPPERDLAQRFGVSRTTLRDAIRELQLLGYLEARQGDGTLVRQPDGEALATPFRQLLRGEPQLADDLLQFRRMVEPQVAAMAAERCSAADARDLRSELERQRGVIDRGGRMLAEDVDFHQRIARIAGNVTVLHVLDTLQALLHELRSSMLKGDRQRLGLAQHRAIAEAIIAHQPETAYRAAFEHLQAVEGSLWRGPDTDQDAP